MALLVFLLTITILAASIYAGYRFNMRLYALGVLGAHARRTYGGRSVHRSRSASLSRVQDSGLHLARAGVIIAGSLLLIVVIGLIILVAAIR